MNLRPIVLAAPLLALGACAQPDKEPAGATQEIRAYQFAVSGMT